MSELSDLRDRFSRNLTGLTREAQDYVLALEHKVRSNRAVAIVCFIVGACLGFIAGRIHF